MTDELELLPVKTEPGLSDKVLAGLRTHILSLDIYSSSTPPKLHERDLAEKMGVSRTPVREALSRLEQEGLVKNIPRRGTFVVRKTKKEIIEIIQVWAALESMAARLVTQYATDEQLARFKSRSEGYKLESGDENAVGGAPIDEYSENNIRFHQEIISLSRNETLISSAYRLFHHMRAIRSSTIKHPARSVASVIDHMRIIDALVNRETANSENLVREHALKLAEHVQNNVDFLE